MALNDFRCGAQISVGIGAISDIKPGLRGLKSGVYDPDVWSGRAVQEVSSILAMRSCINVSGL
jgi:hypothetical protein